jgi:hypothetical protein
LESTAVEVRYKMALEGNSLGAGTESKVILQDKIPL